MGRENRQPGDSIGAIGSPGLGHASFLFSGQQKDLCGSRPQPGCSLGKYLLGAGGGTAWIWPLAPSLQPTKVEFYEGRVFGNLTLFDNTVTAVAMDPDSKFVAIGTSEHDIWLYQLNTGRTIASLSAHNSSPVELAFSADGTGLVSIDHDGNMQLWDLSTQIPTTGSHNHSGPINGLVLRQDGNINAWSENTVWTLDARTAVLKHITYIPDGNVLTTSPAGDLTAVYIPYQVSLFEAETGQYIQTLPKEAQDVFLEHYWEGDLLRQFYGALFSPDGKRLFTFGAGGIWSYEMPAGNLVSIPKYGHSTKKAAISSDGKLLVAAIHEFAQPPRLMDSDHLGYGKYLESYEFNSARYVPQYAFSPNNQQVDIVVLSGWEQPSALIIFDANSLDVERKASFEDTELLSLAFNQDGRLVVAGHANGKISFIETETMETLLIIEAHIGPVTSLVFSRDGRYLISAGQDGVVNIWGIR
ncbi:MAG: WD40 repeat domain-containing protein [Anaerolineales bacterium]|nr:WD40 repeat domain-containing protein [Anaerolineales bacterium]